MPITPAPSTFYNLQLKPDFVANTLAELDADLLTYADTYVLVLETNKIYFVQTSEGTQERLEAYDFTNYRHIVDAGGGGGSGDLNYIHNQLSVNTVWSINHLLDKFPSVTALDSAGTQVEGVVDYVDSNSLTLTFEFGISGTAYLN